MKKFIWGAITAMLLGQWAVASAAEETGKDPATGLDEQVQAIKKEVLHISAELTRLQEKLMYPSDTQVTLYAAIAQGDKFRLDAVSIKIDGQNIVHYIYTPKELEALQRGGEQRIYTGNIRSGTHTLDIEVIGKTANNQDYQQSSSHKFYKMKGPKVIEITISQSGASIQSIAD